MDFSSIDIPSVLNAILTLFVAVGGGALGKQYVGKAFGAIAMLADVLADVGRFMTNFSKAMADKQITQEELDVLSADAREIQDHLIAIQGAFGTIVKKKV